MTDEPSLYGDIHYNPVSVSDSIGTIILGIVVLALLAALLRSQGENRRLLAALGCNDIAPSG